jgi:hypothetical protein
MRREYEADYGVALKDEAFVRWREAGARQKEENVVKVCGGIQVTSAIEIGCGSGAVLKRLQELKACQAFCVCGCIAFSGDIRKECVREFHV